MDSSSTKDMVDKMKEDMSQMTKWQNSLTSKDWNELASSPGEKLQAMLWSMKIGKSKQDSFFDLASKLRLTMKHAEELLGKEPKLTLAETYTPIMFVLNSFEEFQALNPTGVKDIAVDDGAKPVSKATMRQIDKYVDFANIAYDDTPGETMVEFLTKNGYTLCYYDQTTDHEQAAHYLAYNPVEKICMIGIKGTSTLQDVFTDILCRTGPFLPETFAHDGMRVAARRIVVRIHSFLEDLFIPLGYRIICTGHSLGAGVAALTAMILHEELHISKVKAYTYATPPVLDKRAALRCKKYIISVVHERDIISRTSLSNMNIMHETLFQVNNLLKEGRLTSENLISTNEKTKEEHVNGTEVLKLVRKIQNEYKLAYDQDLYCPGRVLYMFKRGPESYDVLEKDGTLTGLRTMMICKTMFSDHAILGYQNAIHNILEKNHRFHSVVTPVRTRNQLGTTINIEGWQKFFNPSDRKQVVYYEITTHIVTDTDLLVNNNAEESNLDNDDSAFGFMGNAAKRFSAWRRYNDFSTLDKSLEAFGVHEYLPSKYFATSPEARVPILQEYLRSVYSQGAKSNLDKVMNLIFDFLGAGNTSAAPRFIVKALAFGQNRKSSNSNKATVSEAENEQQERKRQETNDISN